MHSCRQAGKDPLVLVVDDDRMSRFMVRETLEQAGFCVEEAEDGAMGLQSFRDLHPDMVILDVMMPVMDGFSTCAAIRGLPRGDVVPVLMMTGLEDVDSVKKAYASGATDFITKPINFLIMGYRVKYILRSSQTMQQFKNSETLLAEAQRIAQIGSWEMHFPTGEMLWSKEVYRIFGIEPTGGKISLENFLDVTLPFDRQRVSDAFQRSFSGESRLEIEYQIKNTRNGIRSIHSEARINRDETGQPTLVVGYVQDITERKMAEEQIRYLAYFDNLTGLPNRVLFNDYLGRALSMAKRTNSLMAVLFMDLDRFKQINDTLGHGVGDELLKQVADRLVSCIRKCDYISRDITNGMEGTVARFAGDEFLVLLENIHDYYDAARVAQRMIRTISEPYFIQGREISVTSSIGISLYPSDGEDTEEIIKNSDIAMYHAKELGRNNFQFYSRSINRSAVNHLVMENELRKALKREELTVYYQPMIDISEGKIVSVEALTRWQSAELGSISPVQFIPLAEEAGLIDDIDSWVLHTACGQIKDWQKRLLPELNASINISGFHFKKNNLLEIVDHVLCSTGLDPKYLELEITEGILMSQDSDTLSTLASLKGRGIRLSMDDFGTGYSSFSYLKSFPLDVLKIDQSFIRELISDPNSASIISAIIAMSRVLKLETVAEGVENREQMEILLEKGCRKMQGFWFSHPLCAAEFESFLKNYGFSRSQN